MSIVRSQGRPKQGEWSVGKTKIIAETTALIRAGDPFRSSKDLASRLQVTPALLNYYFGKRLLFLDILVVDVIESYKKEFDSHLEGYALEDECSLASALLTVIRMFRQDRGFVFRYLNIVKADNSSECLIGEMKRRLSAVLERHTIGSENQCLPTFAEIIWGTCAAAKDEASGLLCMKIAYRMVSETVILSSEFASEDFHLSNLILPANQCANQ